MYIQRNIHPAIKSHLRRKEYTIDYRTTDKKEIDLFVTTSANEGFALEVMHANGY